MRSFAVSVLLSATCCLAQSAELVVPMDLIDAAGSAKPIGAVTISESAHGLVFTPAVDGLPPGVHGFHVHENGSCKSGVKDGQPVAGLAAGGHYDPLAAKHHGLPWGDGHLGDLPGLVVDAAGRSTYAVLAPRLKLDDVRSRSLMIHLGGDNHADHPQPLGGGGARMACGVIGG